MIYLAFDLSSVMTGWSVFDDLELIHYGQIKLAKHKKDLKDPFKYLNVLFDEICILIKEHNPDIIAVEDIYLGRNAKTLKSLAKCRGMLELACSKHTKKLEVYSALVARRIVFGNGKIDKLEISNILAKKYGPKVVTSGHDITDAIVIGLCVSKPTVKKSIKKTTKKAKWFGL